MEMVKKCDLQTLRAYFFFVLAHKPEFGLISLLFLFLSFFLIFLYPSFAFFTYNIVAQVIVSLFYGIVAG